MRNLFRASVATAALVCAAGATYAQDCTIEGEGSVRILSNDFTALHLIASRAEECASDKVEITKNQTTEHRNIQVAALTTNPANYTVAVVANSALIPLLGEGLVRPLDDLVEKYGQQLQPHQLIKIDGKTMAIAFMANTQHFVYRKDILEENGIEPPTTYEEVLAAAEKLKAAGHETPFLANFKSGWHVGEEFVNMYFGMEGQFFEPGTANVTIQNEEGVATLEMLKALTEYHNPDFSTFDTNVVGPAWLGGEGVMMTRWGSAVGPMIDPESEVPEITTNTVPVGALTVAGNDTPATTLWWDGFTIASNISDADAEVSFQAMMHGIAPELAQEHPTDAAWLIKGYEPTPAAAGVFATVQAGANPYPMTPHMGVLHTALGDNLGEYLQGLEGAEQALADVTAAYEAAAREAGFIN